VGCGFPLNRVNHPEGLGRCGLTTWHSAAHHVVGLISVNRRIGIHFVATSITV